MGPQWPAAGQESPTSGFPSFPSAVRKVKCCFLCLMALHMCIEPHFGLELTAFETHSGHFSQRFNACLSPCLAPSAAYSAGMGLICELIK